MRMARREHGVMLAIAAVLLIATAWVAVGDRSSVTLQDPTRIVHTERETNGTISPVELGDAAVAPMLGAARSAEPRLVPLWILPGLAAALAALCLLRRLRRSPERPARRALLRGILSSRAPPLRSIA